MYLAKLQPRRPKPSCKTTPSLSFPMGSTEQHGPQCALGTDFNDPQLTLADRIADLDNVLVVPAVPTASAPIT